MRRFLVVGCGGSGGATLAYLMDQLRSDLAAHGIQQLPRGWQFLQLDVPSSSPPGPAGVGSVEQQGGRYFGAGPKNTLFSAMDRGLSSTLGSVGALDGIGTWAPRSPEDVGVPLSMGAGQYRAIGRMITLTRASEIRARLNSAWEELYRPATISEMSQLVVPGLGAYEPSADPVVLVVSSMAGGAGASMALDVCRLLTLVHGVDPKLMGVFMVAPNIFDALPESARTGVRPNALAMLGEIVASQAGAARAHDVSLLGALGESTGDGAPIPFARVFPVGRFSGVDRTLFGDGTPNAVYRGLGRGLAGMMVSGKATQQFLEYDLANTASPNGDRDKLGWGTSWDPLAWGSYGFGSLSMGRDRYAEYAAQRLARTALDRLLSGHLQPGSTLSGTEQLAALVESQWATTCVRLGLPALTTAQQQVSEFDQWFVATALPRVEADQAARNVVQRELEPFVPDPTGVQAAQWLPALRQQLLQRRAALATGATMLATEWAFRWQQGLLERTVSEVERSVSTLGLAYTVALMDRLSLHLRDLVLPNVERLSGLRPQDLAAIPADVEPTLGGLKGVVADGQHLRSMLLSGYHAQVRREIYGQAAGLVHQLVPSFIADVLASLTGALTDMQRLLEQKQAEPLSDIGLARLATDQCAAWPSDDDQQVPRRFDEADNEVLLTASSAFPAQYEADIQAALPPDARAVSFADARAGVVTRVVCGQWETTGGERAPGGLVTTTSAWRSKVFAVDPVTGQPVIPSQARFDVHARPAELLARARAFVARPQESFNIFCRLSLRDYVRGEGVAESQLHGRRVDLVDKFRTTLTVARPLISVSAAAVQAVHGSEVRYRYKFSDIPLDGLAVLGDLQAVLSQDPLVDPTTLSNASASTTDDRGVTRIDVFGSYPGYSPLVFDAVLSPAAEQWARTPEMGRNAFWQWRRTRPLAAALPMGADERRAMVAGWLLGQVVGRVRIPSSPFTQAVSVWDEDADHWTDFPHPLLTPPSQFRADYDWLPAVLESVLLAIARAHDAPIMSSLRPYQLLRRTYDSGPQEPTSGILEISASTLVTNWLRTGDTPPGGVSRVPEATGATSPHDRAEAATAWLESIRELAGTHFMSAGRDGAPGGGAFSVVSTRAQATATPIFRDLAPDVYWATQRLVELIERGRTAALVAPTGSTDAGGSVIVPQAGTF